MLKIESFLLWFGLILSVCHNSKRIVTHNFDWASKMLKHYVTMVISYPIPPPFSPPPPFPPVPHPSPSPHSLLPFLARRGTLPLTESHSAPNKSEFVPCYRNFGYNPS